MSAGQAANCAVVGIMAAAVGIVVRAIKIRT